MKTTYDLSRLNWMLSGWTPHVWRTEQSMEIGAVPRAEVPSIPAKVPGSVQYSLRKAGMLPDWNIGLNHRACEWVENRHWVYETVIPDEWIEPGKAVRLDCRGLDYCGCVTLNGQTVAEFVGSHVPHVFDLAPHLADSGNILRIAFESPPRWLGQVGYTSRMKEWKVRFNYTWDWVPRLVQIGIHGGIYLEVTDGREIADFHCVTNADPDASTGSIHINGRAECKGGIVRATLSREGSVIRVQDVPVSDFNKSGLVWDALPVDLWWPNMQGDQPLYDLACQLLDSDGIEIDSRRRRVGFMNVVWRQCEGAPEEAYPYLCFVNGKPIFLQGVNWTPILPNFADATCEDYRKRLEIYKDMGCNIMRVWGGATLERECFYNICDELGLMVWQEFPMSSSGIDNWPPDDQKAIDEMAAIAESYIARRQHHVSLIIWCGGNELQMDLDGRKEGCGKPVDVDHPMIGRLQKVVQEHDPTRRFLPTSPAGLRFYAASEDFGKGIHWHVHGPWNASGKLDEYWTYYFTHDDAGFRSETGAPGASSAEIIRKYAGEYDTMPANSTSPLWRRTSIWWIEWDQFIVEVGREPRSLEEYVEWNQARQAKALSIAVKSCKDRFPRCGGFIIWMGHDCFPCTANTSIIDFEGNLKPAALAVREVFRLESQKVKKSKS